jgi:hypothetical protein
LTEDHERFELKPFPTARRLMVDGGRLGRQRHTIHGLFEIDVTQPRRTMRAQKVRTGKSPSFTAFVMACLGHAVDLNRHMHAYRDWRGRLVIFDEVDVNTLFEVEVDGRRMIRPHIIRAVNKKSFPELNTEVRTFQSAHQESSEARFVDWFTRLPATLRRLSLGLALQKSATDETHDGHGLHDRAGHVRQRGLLGDSSAQPHPAGHAGWDCGEAGRG